MLIAKELAIKVLGALAVGGTVIGGGIAFRNSGWGASTNNAKAEKVTDKKELEELKEKGLNCENDYCTLADNKTLTVKHGDNITSVLNTIPENAGKIRVYKQKEGKNNKFTFSIEGGDIAITQATASEDSEVASISKLEEFETYEFEETAGEGEQKNYFFKRKTKASDEIKKLLGLGDCDLPEGNEDSTCDLDAAKLKAIKFEGKSGNPTIDQSGSAKLTISSVPDADKENDTTNNYHYPFDYIFKLSGEKQVKIPVGSEEIVKKANETVEFRIKVTPVTSGPRTITLEKVWDVEKFAGKLGFTECNKDTKTCKFPEKINVYKSETESVKEATVTSHSDKTISFEEDASDFEGGVKFTVATAITISEGTQKTESSPVNSIEAGNYEIKQQTVDSVATTWYLSKKG